jgi:preprotein translocase subunit SecA
MSRYMADQGAGAAYGQKYNREGLYHWYLVRYGKPDTAVAAGESPPTPGPETKKRISEEEFRTDSRAHLHEKLVAASKEWYPTIAHDDIDAKLREAFTGAKIAEAGDAQEIAEWAKNVLDLDIDAERLTGASVDQARDVLWNAFDSRYRPEMRRMERSLLLNQVDVAWKNHLLAMDHLRSGIGLVGYAQLDAKTEYKRVGMKEFNGLWETLSDKVTDIVFRMEDDEELASESVYVIGQLIHEAAPQLRAPEGSMQADQQTAISNSQQSDKKQEPIRNRGDKVGRNDPCPCGSGKKYKNCHMRLAAK